MINVNGDADAFVTDPSGLARSGDLTEQGKKLMIVLIVIFYFLLISIGGEMLSTNPGSPTALINGSR